MTTEIRYYAESLGNGRAIMRVDVVRDGVLVDSRTDGSPAPIETVRKCERVRSFAVAGGTKDANR
jgi:hypothetical protein